MALTTQEEALVRQLLDQQAAILSLARNEATITSKLGATKVTLADLVAASSLADADLLLTRQGANDKSVTAKKLAEYIASQVGIPTAVAGGTADAITADFTPNVTLTNGTTVIVRAGAANTTTTPTFAPDGLTAKRIVKGNNLPLAAGDIAGAGHWLVMNFDTTLDKWVLQNPVVTQASDTRAGIVELATAAEVQAGTDNTRAVTPAGLAAAAAVYAPPGMVAYFARNTAPSGWLKANGAAVSRTTYAALFAAIGTTYGAGDGSTTFNLPDLRAEFIRGWDDGRGVDSGRAFGSAQADAMQGHGHENTSFRAGSTGGTGEYLGANNVPGGETRTGRITTPVSDGTNGTPRTASETRPRNIALLACIKY